MNGNTEARCGYTRHAKAWLIGGSIVGVGVGAGAADVQSEAQWVIIMCSLSMLVAYVAMRQQFGARGAELDNHPYWTVCLLSLGAGVGVLAPRETIGYEVSVGIAAALAFAGCGLVGWTEKHAGKMLDAKSNDVKAERNCRQRWMARAVSSTAEIMMMAIAGCALISIVVRLRDLRG